MTTRRKEIQKRDEGKAGIFGAITKERDLATGRNATRNEEIYAWESYRSRMQQGEDKRQTTLYAYYYSTHIYQTCGWGVIRERHADNTPNPSQDFERENGPIVPCRGSGHPHGSVARNWGLEVLISLKVVLAVL